MVTHRQVYFDGRWLDTPIYDRSRLRADQSVAGPAVVEEPGSTTVVLPEYRAEVDGVGNLMIAPA